MAARGSRRRLARLVSALRPNVLVRLLSGSAVIWRFLPEDETPASAIHHVFQRETWREAGIAGRVGLCLGFVLWAPVTLVLAALCTRRAGARVQRETGKSRLRQLVEQLGLACRLAVPPPWYYVFELYDDGRRALAAEYLYRFETKTGIYELMREWLSSPETTEALSDKARFALRCQEHGVPVVRALATVTDGHIVRLDGGGPGLPRRSLFVKPIKGAGGRGAVRWIYHDDGSYESNDGEVLTEQYLAARLEAASRIESYVVRDYVRNHEGIADLSPGVLSTVRVVTCLDENGHGEVTHAVLRMARTDRVIVDNFHAGGIASAVDIRTGRLGSATNMGLTKDTDWWDRHPATGAQILGREVPLWSEVMDVACRAHAAFADQVAIGWDVAVLQDGPYLVEGNKSPDLDIIQRVGREPIGNSRFGELVLFHLRRVLAKKYGYRARVVEIARPLPEAALDRRASGGGRR